MKKSMLKADKATLKRVIRLVSVYKKELILSLLLALVYSVLSLCVPLLTGEAVNTIIGKSNVDFDGLIKVLCLIVICASVSGIAQYLMERLNSKIAYSTVRTLRLTAFSKIKHIPLSVLDQKASGDTVSRMMTDVNQFSDGLILGFSQLFTGLITIIGTLCFMFLVNSAIALVVVLVTPVSLFVAAFIAGKTHSMFALQSKARATQTAMIDEMITGQKVITAFSDQEDAFRKFDEANENLRSASLRAIFFSSITNPSTRFVNSLVYAAVCLSGAFAAMNGMLNVGQLTSFLAYASQYTKPFNEISGVITELQNALVCASRVFELIDSEQETESGATVLYTSKGNVKLDNVHFSYVENKPLIENMNLSVTPGQRIAIVGPTGCGKTTLINLLMRFYDVKSGTISVDSYDIRTLTRTSLRENYGMVLQDTWLRSGTIKENIAFGKPDATDEEICLAAKAAHADSFIRRLPDGYDTVIGEDGGALSQGQKQLLCIARVMLCLPPMLILDEATSSIDTRTEMQIQSAFARLMQGRTSFIVAHRLSTIRSADVILVMKDGHIIEQGNHQTLMAQNGFYAQLYNSQTGKA